MKLLIEAPSLPQLRRYSYKDILMKPIVKMNGANRFTRRRFLGTATTAATAVAALGSAPAVLASDKTHNQSGAEGEFAGFPKDFWWGVATAAYQIEGATHADGRGPCIWDTFCKEPGKIEGGANADIACDEYHRYEEDVKLMAELGVKHYRFSISWSRILPEGRGRVNEKGVDYYRRLVHALLKHGITPHATLYHWDLPQALQDRYAGWQSREVAKDFGDYASAVVKRLGDRIKYWMTLNEISSFCLGGYGVGHPGFQAPGIELKTDKQRWQVVHNALLAHGMGCQAIRAASPDRCHVAPAENYQCFVPIIESAENIEAVRRAFTRETLNGGILMPLLTGHYDEDWLKDRGAEAPDIADGDMKIIGQPLDGLGANCYTGTYVQAADNPKGYTILPMFSAYPKGNLPWLHIVPSSTYWAVRMISDAAGRKGLPVFISENGYVDCHEPSSQGEILDTDRVMYYRTYQSQLQRAVAEGYPVAGYFAWSMLDNFNWENGYTARFGLVHVNFQTQQRTPKLSYRWYQNTVMKDAVC